MSNYAKLANEHCNMIINTEEQLRSSAGTCCHYAKLANKHCNMIINTEEQLRS